MRLNGNNLQFFLRNICIFQKIVVLLHPLLTKARKTLCAEREGKLSEWSKEPHSKCGVRITSYRGFESLTFRKENEKPVCLSLLKQAGFSFSLHRMPSADCWDYEEIPHFPGCQR